jgi:hypothetical protein
MGVDRDSNREQVEEGQFNWSVDAFTFAAARKSVEIDLEARLKNESWHCLRARARASKFDPWSKNFFTPGCASTISNAP